MKKLLITIIVFVTSITSSIALEPIKVAILYQALGTPSVEVNIKDYESNQLIYNENFGSLTPNTSGIITFTLGISNVNWKNITIQEVNSYTVIDIYLNNVLYAQYRLDQLIISQAQSSLMNVNESGSLIPDNTTQSLGTDSVRWSDLYVGPSSVHIGQPSAEGTIKYNISSNELELYSNGTKEVVIGQKKTTINDSLDVANKISAANLVVSSAVGVKGDHIALFENTSGTQEADGIAIKIDTETLSARNRFISFLGHNDYLAGRIESYDLAGGDLWETFPTPNFATLFNVFDFNQVLEWTPPSASFNLGTLPTASFDQGSLPSASFDNGKLPSIDFGNTSFNKGKSPSLDFNKGSLPSLNFNPGSLPSLTFDPGKLNLNFTGIYNPSMGLAAATQLGTVAGWGMRNGYPGFFPTSPWEIAAIPVVLSAMQVARNQGIVYGSKSADYAEWLEKENPEQDFVYGEVVGVKGGKISNNTVDADQVMSISMNPIVLGNMPSDIESGKYEKVGFLGQVPVLVVGKVRVGDYVVASGNNDGYAIAKSADEIKIDDLKNIIGVAWEASNTYGRAMINVSVGLKTNEWVEIFRKQDERLSDLEYRIEKLEQLQNQVISSY